MATLKQQRLTKMSVIEDARNAWIGLLPKEETEALQFIRTNSSWDGRGVIVGILDTGVDPGAIGLETTSDGRRKVIDVIDCSGSGDVRLGSPVLAEDGCLSGFGGRRILINQEWSNPSGLYRIGYKAAYELYPNELKRRVKEERKKQWVKEQRAFEAQYQQELLAAAEDAQEDIKAKIAQLRSLDKDIEDPGPIYDCVVFFDGSEWQAAVDTSETGDLRTAQPMSSYRLKHEYRRLSDLDALNFSVNIYDDGAVLSIVTDAGAHGTHVAGIVGAYYPDQPECNGVAPGAQIVSLKIGDSRLGSMETGVGLMRGLIEAVRTGCHIINMSYGEATAWDNYGAFVSLAEEVVRKHGIIFVSSAGNNGPAISTVGCPGGTSTCCIGVGAYVTHSLMTAAYSMHSAQPASSYTWSSVGPTVDGDLGVSIMAPGGAVVSVPTWTLNKKKLMNGTSMSSPNAAGCIALVVSAALATGVPASPIRVRRAVELSAHSVPGVHVLCQGNGLVQVAKAWERLRATAEDQWADTELIVEVNSERFSRGIYLRQPTEAATANSFQVTITPYFKEDAPADEKIQFEMRLRLESTASWVSCPSHVLLLRDGKQFQVAVDPRALPAGLHVEFIKVYNEALPADRSLVQTIPITVVRPEIVAPGVIDVSFGEANLKSGDRMRKFIVPPHGCSFIDLHVKDLRAPTLASTASVASVSGEDTRVLVEDSAEDDRADTREDAEGPTDPADDSVRTLAIHALQLFRGTPYRENEHDRYLAMRPGGEHVVSWAVQAGVTMEMVFAPLWSAMGDIQFSATMHFRGVVPTPSHITLLGGQRVSSQLRVEAVLAQADLAPAGKLDKWTAVTKPLAAGKVLPLGSRDVLPDGTPLYQLVLEYDFDQQEDGEVTPRWPGLQGVLYESDFHAQFFMVYDSKKKLLGSGDAWPSATKIGKGKHTVRLQVRHSSPVTLEALSDLCMLLERPLKSSIALGFFKTQSEALVGTNKQGGRAVPLGGSVSMYIREPSQSQLPKQASPGDFLTGSFTCLKSNNSQLGAGTKPGGYAIRYVVADSKVPASKDKPAAASTVKKAETEEQKLAAVVKEAKVKYLKGLAGKQATFEPLFESLVAEFPDDLQIRQACLTHFVKCHENATKKNKLSTEFVDSVVNAAGAVQSLIDSTAVAAELGVNLDKDDEEAVARRKEVETQKAALVEAFSSTASVLLDALTRLPTATAVESASAAASADSQSVASASPSKTREQIQAEFGNALKSLARWDDLSADKHWRLSVQQLKLKGKVGLALKRISELVATSADNKPKEGVSREALFEERDICLQQLGLGHALAYSQKWTAVAAKDFFDPF